MALVSLSAPVAPDNSGNLLSSGSGCFGCAAGMGDLTFDGTGLFGTGLFGSSTWGLGEWSVIGLGAFLLLGGLHFGGRKGFKGFSSDRRRKLRLAKAQYDLARAEA